MRIFTPLVILLGAACLLSAADAPNPPAGAKPQAVDWDIIARQLARGELKDDVYTVVLPRSDLDVHHLDMGLIPTAAGIEHRFYFFLCPCGKTDVVGTFAVAEYELNDVIDELRKDNFKIVSTAAMFMEEKPRMMSLRFQAQGSAQELANTLKKALKWTGNGRDKVGDKAE